MAERVLYNVRCLFIDYLRPSNDANEYHWRCPAWFVCDPEADLSARTLCSHHRHLGQLFPEGTWDNTPERVNRGVQAIGRLDAVEEKDAEMTSSERVWATEQKRKILQQARDAGLLPNRDPGEEG